MQAQPSRDTKYSEHQVLAYDTIQLPDYVYKDDDITNVVIYFN